MPSILKIVSICADRRRSTKACWNSALPTVKPHVSASIIDFTRVSRSMLDQDGCLPAVLGKASRPVERAGEIVGDDADAHGDPKLRLKPVAYIAADLAGLTTASAGSGNAPMKMAIDGKI